MEYTAPQPISNGLAKVCPHAGLLATANGNLLTLHSLADNTPIRTVTAAGPISHLAFSPSAPVLLAAASPPGDVVVVDGAGAVLADLHSSPLTTAWLALTGCGTLVLGYEHGLGAALFAPLAGRRLAFVPHARRAVASRCGRFVALLVRAGAAPDALAVLCARTGALLSSVPAPAGAHRLAGLCWARDALAVWGWADAARAAPLLATLSPRGGAVLTRAGLDAPVRALARHDESGVWAVGDADGALVLRDARRGNDVLRAVHDAPVAKAGAPPVVFRERRVRAAAAAAPADADGENAPAAANRSRRAPGAAARRRAREKLPMKAEFEVVPFGPDIDVGLGLRADGGRASRTGADGRARRGVAWTGMSADGRFAASRGDAAPHVVLIWEVASVRLAAVLLLRDEVVSAKWSRVGARLALACGGAFVYMWEARGAAAVRVGGEFGWRKPFCVERVNWAFDDGQIIAVDGSSANAFLTVFL